MLHCLYEEKGTNNMFTKILTKLGFTKEETSWILYDVGNSAQVLTTCTVIFPLLIAKITPGDSSVYVGWANAICRSSTTVRRL